MVERGAGLLKVLDRLQEHDGVGGRRELFDERPLESHVGVAAPYFRRACSKASGLASTPITEAALRASTSAP